MTNNENDASGSVFVASASEDRARVEALVEFLSAQGLAVLWEEPQLVMQGYGPGRYGLEHAGCVVVAWSTFSVSNASVQSIAASGYERGILAPVLLESNVSVPSAFATLQACDLSLWHGGQEQEQGLDCIVQRVRALVGRGRSRDRDQNTLGSNAWYIDQSLHILANFDNLTAQLRTLGDILGLKTEANKDLRGSLKEIGDTYRAILAAILEFLRPMNDPGAIDADPYFRIERGSLRTVVSNGMGHCSKILEHYYRFKGLRDWIKSQVTPAQLAEIDRVFERLSTADGDLFVPLGEIADLLTNESRVILNLLVAQQEEAARQRIEAGRAKLAPLEDALTNAMLQFMAVERALGFVEPSTSGEQQPEPPALDERAEGGRAAVQYVDFWLRIAGSGQVTARSDVGGDGQDTITLEIPSDIKSALNSIEQRKTSDTLLRGAGKRLYDWFFPINIHTQFHVTEALARARDQGIRVRLTVDADALAQIPWEFIYRSQGGYYLSVNPETVFSHYLELPLAGRRRTNATGPLDVLLIISAPNDQAALDPDEWEKVVREALAQPVQEGKMAVRVVKQATRRAISDALLASNPHIIQLVGHGTYQKGRGYVALVDGRTGGTWAVDDERFANLFLGAGSRLGLVSLTTCESAKSDSPRGFLGMAPQLVQRGIPAVIAMQYSVQAASAQVFLDQFYRAVAARKPLDWAVQSGRLAVSEEFGLDNREFAAPVLYMGAANGQVF